MAAIRKRKNRQPSETLPTRPKRKHLLLSDEEDTPTSYEILVNSIPAVKPADVHHEPAETDTESHCDINDEVETAESSSVVVGGAIDEPFSSHYDRVLEESDAVSLKELYSQPLTLNKEQHTILGLVQSLTTPTCNKDSTLKEEKELKSLRDCQVREPLSTLWATANKTGTNTDPFTSLQYHLFEVLNSYKDLVYTNRTSENESEIRRLYVLHCLNHIIKNRSHVLKNNIRLAMAAKEGRDLGEIRDQGLTRPKILILVPFRNSALKIVSTMISILVTPGKGEVANRKKFYKLFSEESGAKPPDYKPASYHQIFTGNLDDCFKLGLSVKKNRLKLFTPFYSSDIILASPLGLRTVIGGEGDKSRDYDFLSSLEMIIIDQSDVFLMQNWDHLLDIFRHLHLQPSDGHGVDFSRVREWSLNCWSQYYCQLIVLSSFSTPEINSLVTSYSKNYEGQVRSHVSSWKGSVHQILKPIPQVFHNMNCSHHHMLPEIRYQYFTDTILSELSSVDQVCVYIPSYFDFVRVRNFFKKEELSYCHISEYTKSASVSRARSFFAKGRKKFLLVTERFHFFRRYQLKGIRHLVFYAPPTYCEFYSELVNQCISDEGKVIVLYSKYDTLSLQRIVGTERISALVNSTDPLHTLVLQ